MRSRITLCFTFLLMSCGGGFDPKLEVAFDLVDGRAQVDAEGRFRVEVTACVPGLNSARATVTNLQAATDAGLRAETPLVLLGPGPNRCLDGGLSGEVWLPGPPAGGSVRLEVAALGERKVIEQDVAVRETPPPPAGTITALAFDPAAIPEGGGIVSLHVDFAGDAGTGDRIAVRTLPNVPIARTSATITNAVEFILAIPEDVPEVWVEACLGASCLSDTARRVGR